MSASETTLDAFIGLGLTALVLCAGYEACKEECRDQYIDPAKDSSMTCRSEDAQMIPYASGFLCKCPVNGVTVHWEIKTEKGDAGL